MHFNSLHPHCCFTKYLSRLLCIWMIFIPANVFCQDPPFISYNEQNGLASSVVYGLFQDSEDNIWFCTNAGVVKFNGNKLTAYKKQDGLPGNEVFKIFEDSQHRLWFMSANGRIGYYRNKKIFNAKDHPVFSKLNIGTFISDIREDENKNIWIIPNSGNVYRLSANLQTFREQPAKQNNGVFFTHGGRDFLCAREGVFSLQSNTLMLGSEGFGPGGFVARHGQAGNLLFSGGYKKLQVYDLENSRSVVYDMPGLPEALNAIVVMDSTLYICSGNGLELFNRNNFKRKEQYFSSSNVSHVLRDREGSLWVSTLNEGVMYIPNSRVNFLRSKNYFDGNRILKVNGMGSHVIVGGANSKVNYYHDGLLTPLISPNESKGEGLTYSIKPFGPDTGFVISTQSGATKFTLPNTLQFDNNIIYLDFVFFERKIAYVSTPSSLGAYSDPLNLPAFRAKQTTAVFDSIRADALYYDDKDSVLYACSRLGLYRYKNRKRLAAAFKELEGLSFTDIGKNANDIFVVTTLGDGVFFFNKEKIIHLNEKTGLADNMCTSLFMQNDSTVWVTTLNGLSRIVFTQNRSGISTRARNFYRNDGLPSNYINDIYIHGDSIWLATNIGLAIFNEHDLAGSQYIPKMTVDVFKANNVNQEITIDKPLQLHRNSNNIIIEFNCNSFKHAGSIVYRYKLAGLHSNWIETRNKQVDFTGLAPGSYSFEVYAFNFNGNWKTNTVTVSFKIIPAFWQTTWFKVLLVAFIILAIILVTYYEFRKVRNKFTLQKKLISYEKELLELEQQALRLQMNPHFIFNALNSIQHSILSDKPGEAYNSLELFSSLIRGILENSKHKFISLEDEIEILEIYIRIEAKRFNGDFTYEIKIDPGIDLSGVKIPPMLIQPFVENSIWHGLIPKASGEKRLLLTFERAGNAIICKIDDNGIGRQEAALAKHKKYASSLGTGLTFNRVSNINRLENKQKYAISIEDKPNSAGTIVIVTIQDG